MMRIGVDFDGTLVDTVVFQLEKGAEFFGKKATNKNGYDVTEMFAVSPEQGRAFWTAYAEEYLTKIAMREGASEVLQKLHDDGDEIYIVTRRRYPWFDGEIGEKIPELTRKWLDEHKIVYEKIVWATEGKLVACKENGVELLVDDHTQFIRDLAAVIPVIRFACGHNEGVNGPNIYRCENWWEVGETIERIKGRA